MKYLPYSVGANLLAMKVGNTTLYRGLASLSPRDPWYDTMTEALQESLHHRKRDAQSYVRDCPGRRIAQTDVQELEAKILALQEATP